MLDQKIIKIILKDILKIKRITNMNKSRILTLFEISKSRYNRWKNTEPQKIKGQKKIATRILPEEEKHIIEYRKSSEELINLGYRKFTWTMVDKNIVFLSETAVYRILKVNSLLGRTFKISDANKEYQQKPEYVHQHWHTDIAYIKLCGVFYYLIFMIDGYSRYILNHELMIDMTGHSVELFTQRTKDMYPDACPMVIHDNGVQFISYDFKNLLRETGCIDVPTKYKHPETNGKAERFIRTIREECIRSKSPVYYIEAVKYLNQYILKYNNERLHSGIKFLKPVDVFKGRKNIILNERKLKLENARKNRIIVNKLGYNQQKLPA